LIPTEENSKSELWLDAHDVREGDSGTSWEFVDQENRVIRRLEKTRVRSFMVTPDRRKPRPLEHSVVQDPRWAVPR
jgi:preprotein translocase subunit SecA